MVGSFIETDLASIFETAVFAVQMLYTPSGGSPVLVTGVFDDEDVEVDHGDSSFIQRSAKLTCPSSSVTGIAVNDVFQQLDFDDEGLISSSTTVVVDLGFITATAGSSEDYGTVSDVGYGYTVAFIKDDGTGVVEIYMEAA